MKLVIFLVGLMSFNFFAQAGDWTDLKGGQGTLLVVDTSVDVSDNNIPTCLFKVAISSDFVFDAAESSTIDLIEVASYVDEDCQLKKGDKLLTTVQVLSSSADLKNPATFFVSVLGAGYQSEIMFPNYGK